MPHAATDNISNSSMLASGVSDFFNFIRSGSNNLVAAVVWEWVRG